MVTNQRKTGWSGRVLWMAGCFVTLSFFGVIAGSRAEGTMDVDRYKEDLSRQIDQIKNQPIATPASQEIAEPKVHRSKKPPEKSGTNASLEPSPKPAESHKSRAEQEQELEQLKAALGQLTQKVGSLEGQNGSFKFSLLLQGRGTVNDNPTVKIGGNNVYEGLDDQVTPGTVHDQFFFRRCEMKFYGALAGNSLQYVVMIDPVGVPASTKNLVQDYFLTYSLIKYLDLTLGQTKYPQGLEARTSSAKLEFINRSVLGSGNGFGDERDLIAQASGSKVPLFQDITFDYALAAVNGQGRNNPENNDNKDGAARLGFQYKGLWLGGSAYDGFEQAPGAATPLEMWRVGLEAQWIQEGFFTAKDNLKFQAEWGQGSLVNENGTTKAAFPVSAGGSGASGFYLEGLYRVENTRIGLRYELWDPRDVAFRSPGTYQNYFTLGLDQFLSEDHLRLSLNWIHPVLDSLVSGTLSVGEVVEGQVQFSL